MFDQESLDQFKVASNAGESLPVFIQVCDKLLLSDIDPQRTRLKYVRLVHDAMNA